MVMIAENKRKRYSACFNRLCNAVNSLIGLRLVHAFPPAGDIVPQQNDQVWLCFSYRRSDHVGCFLPGFICVLKIGKNKDLKFPILFKLQSTVVGCEHAHWAACRQHGDDRKNGDHVFKNLFHNHLPLSF